MVNISTVLYYAVIHSHSFSPIPHWQIQTTFPPNPSKQWVSTSSLSPSSLTRRLACPRMPPQFLPNPQTTSFIWSIHPPPWWWYWCQSVQQLPASALSNPCYHDLRGFLSCQIHSILHILRDCPYYQPVDAAHAVSARLSRPLPVTQGDCVCLMPWGGWPSLVAGRQSKRSAKQRLWRRSLHSKTLFSWSWSWGMLAATNRSL